MRIRRKPWTELELQDCPLLVEQPSAHIGDWPSVFPRPNPIHLEIGCGKGVSTVRMAHEHSEINYIAIDEVRHVLAVAVRNARVEYGEEPIDNLRFSAVDALMIRDTFAASDGIERIYISFPNPWDERAKHHKRRLTHTRQLWQYRAFMKPDGEIWFKTDDDALFTASKRYLTEAGFEIGYTTDDLHASGFAPNYISEHERMFSEQGKPIHFLIARLTASAQAEERMRRRLQAAIDGIVSLDERLMAEARARQERLVKPPHSLGRLEDLSVQLAGIRGQLFNPVDKRRVLIFSADNGIAHEGVASAPQSVTLSQTINFTRGMTGVAVLAKHFHAELDVIDVGIDADFTQTGVRDCKIARGTRSFAREPAMTTEECLRAIMVGLDAAERAKRDHVDILGVGEMGIGNTTTASAVLSALLGVPASDTVSRGAGIDDDAYQRKIGLIADALERYRLDPTDPIDVMAHVGGFDIAAMCGAFLGAALQRIPVVIDGFISAVAALCACRLCPLAADYMIPSHASTERGYALAMEAMRLTPMLHLNMRLGEGSGCPIAFEIVAASQSVLRDMATFAEADIDDGYLSEIRAVRRYQGEA